MVAIMEERFADLNIKFSVGGQISFDAFPVGWDKTFCLRYVVPDNYDEIHFFGDKTYKVRKLGVFVFMDDSKFLRLGIYVYRFSNVCFRSRLLQGGNDHEIYEDARTIGHTVVGPEDTMRQVTEVLAKLK